MRKINYVSLYMAVGIFFVWVAVLVGFPLTHNNEDDSEPQISGGNIVWTYNQITDKEIKFFDGPSCQYK